MNTVSANWIYTPEGWLEDGTISWNPDGTIREVVSSNEKDREGTGAPSTASELYDCIVPGFVNAHSHAFQYGLRGSCQEAHSFDDWVDRSLYPLVREMDDQQMDELVRRAFEHMLRSGFTTVGEFHYIHNDPSGTRRGNEIDHRVIEIARDVGLRVGFIRCFYDKPGATARKRFLETPEEARTHFQSLYRDYEDDPAVNILPGPHSLHGATMDMVRTGKELSRQYEVPYHVHISEQKPEYETFQEEHDCGLLTHLDQHDAFDSRFVGIHGVWLEDQEIRTLAEQGKGLVSCPTTNMLLGDGVSPLVALQNQGGTFALGTDANQRIDAFEEARLAEWLQRTTKLQMNSLGGAQKDLSGQLLHALTASGADLLGFQSGRLQADHQADFVALSMEDIKSFDGGDQPPELENLLFSYQSESLVEQVWVGGEQVQDRTS